MSSPFDSPLFVAAYLEKRDSPRSINNVLDAPTLLELMGPAAGKKILEIGCGAGGMAAQLFPLGLDRYVGIDISEAFIKRARERISDQRFDFLCWDANFGLPDFQAEI